MGPVWELDFYSRPLLDERQKKRWEVLICQGLQSVDADPTQLFRFSKFLSNTDVNSVTLKQALVEAMDQAPVPPSSIRFFRYPMQNMIVRACDELGLPAKASRRTLALHQWLTEREQTVYPTMEGYTSAPSPRVAAPPPSPLPLPDALLGQRWTFVSLPASAFADLPEWDIGFGESFPLTSVDLSPDAQVPGLLIFSPRALALAAWLSGLELGSLRVESGKTPRLLLETGSTESWVLANLPTEALQQEAASFAQAQAAAQQVHFLGVQSDPDSESFPGFWLMQSLELN